MKTIPAIAIGVAAALLLASQVGPLLQDLFSRINQALPF